MDGRGSSREGTRLPVLLGLDGNNLPATTAKLEKMAFHNFSKQSLNGSGIIPRNR